MDEFEWFVFRPLTEEEVLSYLETKTDNPKRLYSRWFETYTHSAFRFYKEQYNRHRLLEFKKFCRANYLKIDYPSLLSNDDVNSWKNWENKAEHLQKHWEVAKEMMSQNSDKYKKIELIFAGEVMNELLQDIIDEWVHKEKDLKAIWFNSNITQPTSKNLNELKSLPYPQYLKSSHWKRIRAAKILIEYARCENCYGDDSFYGGNNELDIHVHHLHYRNLGCERYEDICLLCQIHHREAHSKLSR